LARGSFTLLLTPQNQITMEESTTKEFSPRASAEPTQVSPIAHHHRFAHTKLWALLHDRQVPESDCVCTYCRGAAENSEIDHEQVADRLTQADWWTILDEFLIELHTYCRGESDLAERMRTLRFIRSGLIKALFLRKPPEAGKKCGHLGVG
jgi:hypothetical protein